MQNDHQFYGFVSAKVEEGTICFWFAEIDNYTPLYNRNILKVPKVILTPIRNQ